MAQGCDFPPLARRATGGPNAFPSPLPISICHPRFPSWLLPLGQFRVRESFCRGKPWRPSFGTVAMLHANPRACPLWALVRAIAAGDRMVVAKMLATSPGLARERAVDGATRQAAQAHYLHEIGHYFYAGDTALHIAAAAYQKDTVGNLIALGADVRARNRRGAEPIHYAADGMPGSHAWNPQA